VAEGISFAVQAAPAGTEWAGFAQRVERLGFEALCVADHPGMTASPFVAAAAAVPLTRSLRIGTGVLNGGLREPFDIASDAATLNLVSAGRALLGIGAGHTPAEWAALARTCPTPSERVERLGVLIQLVQQLLAGEAVTHDGPHFQLVDARLELAPCTIPLLVGGNGAALVRIGAAHADIVEIGGLGRTLPDGHFHEPRWTATQIARVIDAFHDAVGARHVRLGALVQFVAVTDQAEAAAAGLLTSLSEHLPTGSLPTLQDLLSAPFVLIGTVDEITDKVLDVRRRWGIDRYTVRAPAVDDVARVIAMLGSRDQPTGPAA
jgi:probable F420-dependent oxidoreductase